MKLSPLNRHNIAAKDLLTAEAYSIGSALLNALPDKANLIGNDLAPSYTSVRWRRLHFAADALRAEWAGVDGHDDAGRTPNKYGMAAVFLVDREAMDTLQRQRADSRHAMTYRLGSAALYGSSPDQEIFGLESDEDSDYRVAMRVGKGPLVVSAGVFARSHSGRPLYAPLAQGIRAAEVLPVMDIPAFIPLI